MPTVDSSAPGASEKATGDRVESPEACDECTRLDKQETAALLAGDHSRATDVRVMRRNHRQTAHPALYDAAVRDQRARDCMHSEASQRGRWVA